MFAMRIELSTMTHDDKDVDNVHPLTILLPVLNGERWLSDSLESIRLQTFQDFEVLIIDDGCTDNSMLIARSMNFKSLRIIRGPQQGLGAALACGVLFSSSPFLARQDQDDLSAPDRLEKQMAYMAANPDCVIVGSWAQQIDEDGAQIRILRVPKTTRSINLRMNFDSPFIHTSVLLRRDAVLTAGNYRPSPKKILAEDYDLWSRMLPLGELHNIQKTLVSYRMNSQGITGTQGPSIRRSAIAIAIRNTEASLGKRLSDSDKQLYSLFFRGHTRINLNEAVRIYRILFLLLFRPGFPPPITGIYWRHWLAPLVWIVRAPRHAADPLDG